MPKTVKIQGVLRADTFGRRLTGLMGKGRWPRGWGGLAFPECRAVHTFFTFLGPDILFVDGRGRILDIFKRAGAWRFFLGSAGSRHCLELPGGFCGENSLEKGDILQWEEK